MEIHGIPVRNMIYIHRFAISMLVYWRVLGMKPDILGDICPP